MPHLKTMTRRIPERLTPNAARLAAVIAVQ